MGYNLTCLILAAVRQAHAFSPDLVHMGWHVSYLLANFSMDYPEHTRALVKAGVSDGQSPCWQVPARRVCTYTFARENQAGLDCELKDCTFKVRDWDPGRAMAQTMPAVHKNASICDFREYR